MPERRLKKCRDAYWRDNLFPPPLSVGRESLKEPRWYISGLGIPHDLMVYAPDRLNALRVLTVWSEDEYNAAKLLLMGRG